MSMAIHLSALDPLAVIFDLDGTLIDSTSDIATGANMVREHFGLAPWPEADVAAHIGWGLGHLLVNTLPELGPEEVQAGRAVFLQAYGTHLLDHTVPYPMVPEALSALSAADIPLGLVTNKPGMFLEPVLEGLSWQSTFGCVFGGDTLPTRKPDPGPLLEAAAALEVPPARCLYVGDTEVDAEAASRAEMPFACVPWGRAAEGVNRVDSSTVDFDALAIWARR
ncbi:MAG: HAD family hydrolase [Bradymonadia bacterium]